MRRPTTTCTATTRSPAARCLRSERQAAIGDWAAGLGLGLGEGMPLAASSIPRPSSPGLPSGEFCRERKAPLAMFLRLHPLVYASALGLAALQCKSSDTAASKSPDNRGSDNR